MRGLRPNRSGTDVALDLGVAVAVRALPLDRECGAELLRFRLGVDAAGGRLFHGVPGADPCAPLRDSDRHPAMDAVSHGDGRRAHQAASRPVLARSYLPLLPLRNSATAQSPELVLSP